MKLSVSRALIVLVSVAIVGVLGWSGWTWFEDNITGERCVIQRDDDEPLRLTAEQTRHAAIIVAASYEAGLPERAAVVALATAFQESDLRNLNYGDRDSLGLFQQRPSQGWGTEEQIMDPWYSAGRFYEELVKFDNWETRDITEMAQKVQRSAYPEAYRKHEGKALALAGALRGSRPATLTCVDKQQRAGKAQEFQRAVAAVPGVTQESSDDRVVLRADDQTALWSAAQLAVAHTRAAGITSVVVGDREWRGGRHRSWDKASTPSADGTAEVRLR